MTKAMGNHAKPADKAKLFAELEALEPKDPPEIDESVINPPVKPVVTPIAPVVPKVDDDPADLPPTPPAAMTIEEKIAKLEADNIEKDKKFADSARGAQKLLDEKKIRQENAAKADALPEPTDDEMITEYGDDWDGMDPGTQKMARNLLHEKRKTAIMKSTDDRIRFEESHVLKIQAYAADPETIKQFPAIEGKEDEFEHFAKKSSRVAMDLEDVAALFVASIMSRPKAPGGSLFPKNTPIVKAPAPVKTGISPEQATALRTKDHKKYEQLVREKKILPSAMLD